MKLEYIIFTFSFLYFGFSSPSHPVPSAGAEDGPTGENNFYTLYILTETFLPVERILVLRWELVTDPMPLTPLTPVGRSSLWHVITENPTCDNEVRL